MQANNIRPMVEGGILSAVAIVFALISAYIPVVGAFVNMIWPVPIILLGIRHGYKWSIMATLTAGLLIAMMMHPLHAVSVVVGFGLIGIVLGYALRAGFSPGKAILWGTAASLVSKGAVLVLSALILGINPLEMQTQVLVEAEQQALEIYRNFGMTEEQLAQLSASMKMLIEVMKIVIPSGFVFASVFDTYLNFQLARLVLAKLGQHIPGFPPFKVWSMPRYVGYFFILSLVMLYWGQTREIYLLKSLALNMFYLTGAPLFVQGLALFYYLADKYSLSRLAWSIILVLIFMNGTFMMGTLFAGLLDLGLDYRRLRTGGQP